MVQTHKVIPGTVAPSQSVQQAVNMKSTIHCHHVVCGSHVNLMPGSRNDTCGIITIIVCVPPLFLTHYTKINK